MKNQIKTSVMAIVLAAVFGQAAFAADAAAPAPVAKPAVKSAPAVKHIAKSAKPAGKCEKKPCRAHRHSRHHKSAVAKKSAPAAK